MLHEVGSNLLIRRQKRLYHTNLYYGDYALTEILPHMVSPRFGKTINTDWSATSCFADSKINRYTFTRIPHVTNP